MTRAEKLYWRTQAGCTAWACADSGLPAHYRRILGAMQAPTGIEALAKAVGVHGADLLAWLEQLDTLGFVQTGPNAYRLRVA
jgi:predicted hotdog family 3-hydroxylacyl-ACP dehydratase